LILLISNIANEAAPAFINSYPAGAVSLITASNFNHSFKAGISVNKFSSSSLVINDHEISPDDISGVITTVPGFSPLEFYYINPADKDYVCAEVNSFVNYFLSELKCKKINPPTRKSLSGLGLQKIEWITITRKLNVPVQPFTVKNGKYEYLLRPDQRHTVSCTIINNRMMENEIPERVHGYMKLLSGEFPLPYLRCYFSTSDDRNFNLLEIDSIPDITIPQNRDALMNYF
jgi:hypothetical protein